MNNKQKTFQIYLKGEDKTSNVRSFRHFENKCEVTFTNGKVFTYNAANVRIIESVLNNSKAFECFKYLKEIAEVIGLKVEIDDEKVVNILSCNYSKIDFKSDSMLDTFLNGNIPRAFTDKPALITDEIYPFGFNVSQKKAVENALINQLSIIEGPPGTGKTQTILNIIANAIVRGESVAVVSSNNSATKNVLDKLKKYNVDFIAAYLGNTVNKKDFISSQNVLPDIKAWKLEAKDILALQQDLKIRYNTLQEKLVQQNELSVLKSELSALEIEQKYFMQYIDGFGSQLGAVCKRHSYLFLLQ
ncbi:MAG: AAA domain-containing protein [Vampirovibrionales bacterium]